MNWSLHLILERYVISLMTQVQFLRSNDSGGTSWPPMYHFWRFFTIPSTLVNSVLSSCTKLVNSREQGWYLMPFSCTHEALNTSSSVKEPQSRHLFVTLANRLVKPGDWFWLPRTTVNSLIIQKSMSAESVCEVFEFFCISWLNPWNADTWLQIALPDWVSEWGDKVKVMDQKMSTSV